VKAAEFFQALRTRPPDTTCPQLSLRDACLQKVARASAEMF
jgi:hypothetical protein